MKLKEVNKNSACRRCLYFVPDPDGLGVRCAAYPFGNIPKKFVSGEKVHDKKEPGQTGDAVFSPEVEYMTK